MYDTNSSLNESINQEPQLACFYLDILPYEESHAFFLGILLCFVNGISSIVAILANIIIIVLICKNPALHSNSNFLLCCLAFSDAFVGIVVQPSYMVSKIGELTHNYSIHCRGRMSMETIAFISSGASLCTLAVISLDMFLALYLHLRYKDLVTKRRLLVFIVLSWIVVTVGAPLRIWLDNTTMGINLFVAITFNLLIISFSYYKILKVVRRHAIQINNVEQLSNVEPKSRGIADFLKHKKLVYTMLYVALLVLVSYAPFGCVVAVYISMGNSKTLQTAFDITITLMLINSSINPVYYYFRIAEIRRAVLKTLKINRIEELNVAKTTRRAETNM